MRAPFQKVSPASRKKNKASGCLNLYRAWWFILTQQAMESKQGMGSKEKKERKFGNSAYLGAFFQSVLMWEKEMIFLFSLKCNKHQSQNIEHVSSWLEAYRSRWAGAFCWVLLETSLAQTHHPACELKLAWRRRGRLRTGLVTVQGG